jgi:hypothetical protein
MLFLEKELNSLKIVLFLQVSQIPQKTIGYIGTLRIPEKSGLLLIVTAKLLQKHGLSR